LEDAGGYLVSRVAAPEGDVGAVREQLARLDRRPVNVQVELFELVADLDRALRVPDRDVLEAELAPPRLDAARAVAAARGEVIRGELGRSHVDGARRGSGDARPD